MNHVLNLIILKQQQVILPNKLGVIVLPTDSMVFGTSMASDIPSKAN